jgi:hypothetical protein
MNYEFYVKDGSSWYGVFTEGERYVCVEQDVAQPYATTYPCGDPTSWVNTVQRYEAKGKPLSQEDQRRKKDFEEQVQQLNSAIKLNEQTIEHHERLISNYKSRQQDLQDMIKKLEGV